MSKEIVKPEKRSRFRKIEVRMWGDQKFCDLSPLPPCGQGLWMFLLTGPHTGPIPGLFRAGRAAMAEELNWDQEAFDKAFLEVLSKGMVDADWKAKVVWIPNAISCNRPESPNVVRSWASEWDLIPECELKLNAYHALKASIHALGEAFGKAFNEAISEPSVKPSRKTCPNQEQEQEQEQYKNKEAAALLTEETTAPEDVPKSPPLSGQKNIQPIPDEAPNRATQIVVLLRRNGGDARTHSTSKGVAELVELQATDAQVLTALETAKQRRQDSGSAQPVTAAYLVPIVQGLQNQPGEKPHKPPRDEWWKSTEATDRKARELGMFARAGEDYPSFRERIFTEIKQRSSSLQEA